MDFNDIKSDVSQGRESLEGAIEGQARERSLNSFMLLRWAAELKEIEQLDNAVNLLERYQQRHGVSMKPGRLIPTQAEIQQHQNNLEVGIVDLGPKRRAK